MEFVVLLRLVGMMNLNSFCRVHSIFKGKNRTCVISLNMGLYSDIYRLISFKRGMMIEITKLYILI